MSDDALDWDLVQEGLEGWRAQLADGARVAVSSERAAIEAGDRGARFEVGRVVRVTRTRQIVVLLDGDLEQRFSGALTEETTRDVRGPKRALYPLVARPDLEMPLSVADSGSKRERRRGSLSATDSASLNHKTEPPLVLEDDRPAAYFLLPVQVPFAELDSTPVEASDVRKLREILGLSTTRFGELLGSSRQRVYVWEAEGTGSAHGSISALMRLYLAMLPPALMQDLHDEDPAPTSPTGGAPPVGDVGALPAERASRGGALGFGWWREQDWHDRETWHLYYATPYQEQIARALESTPHARWDKDYKRWELPDTDESVQLLEDLVRTHWGFDLAEVESIHLDHVGRRYRAPVGELYTIQTPNPRWPDGVYGRVLYGRTYEERSDGWDDGWHCAMIVRRVGEEDEEARGMIQQARAQATNKAAEASAAEEASATDTKRAEAIRADWAARGMSVEMGAGYNMPAGSWTTEQLLHHRWTSYSGATYSELTGDVDGRQVVIGQVHTKYDSDWWDTKIYVRPEDADQLRVAQVLQYSALRAPKDEALTRAEQLRRAVQVAREHYPQPEYLIACEAALAAEVARATPPIDLAPRIEGTRRVTLYCDRKQDALYAGKVAIMPLEDAADVEWLYAIAVVSATAPTRQRDDEADPYSSDAAGWRYTAEVREATEQELAALDKPDWLKARVGKRYKA
jgi:hypothetical protein